MRFSVSYTFKGSATEIIEAGSQEEAEAIVGEKVEDENFEIEADSIDDVDFFIQQMHPVTRDGREIWTTWIKGGDTLGHQSAIDKSPLFSGVPEQEAAPTGAVG